MKRQILRLILGDQLNIKHSWFDRVDDSVVYVMMEVMSEQTYVVHHIQKTVSFLLAMRTFRDELLAKGHRVNYITLDDPENQQQFSSNLERIIESFGIERFEYQLPDEYRLDQELAQFARRLSIPSQVFDSEHFLTPRDFLAEFFAGKKTYLMETFYRKLRVKHQVLMEGDAPVGGAWNYDAENRNAYHGQDPIPPYPETRREVGELVEMLSKMKVKTIGEIQSEHFVWPLTRLEGLQWLAHFVQYRLANFGKFQDAMALGEPWLFHSRLSFLLNAKLLHPLEVIRAAEIAWKTRPTQIPLPAVEGFIRQILGWREFVRGVYWARMPEFAMENYFGHDRPLPPWYWTGKTRMRCLSSAIGQSLRLGYAHHIQRLMVTGNFALLAGIHPDEVDAWYLGIYVDAIEWVEMPNTRGMSQYADGGWVGSKPYVSGGNYISKMSNYCASCHYDSKDRTGPRACPFNSLYWHFHHRHRAVLERHPRIGMAYRTWDKMEEKQQKALLGKAEEYLANLSDL